MRCAGAAAPELTGTWGVWTADLVPPSGRPTRTAARSGGARSAAKSAGAASAPCDPDLRDLSLASTLRTHICCRLVPAAPSSFSSRLGKKYSCNQPHYMLTCLPLFPLGT